MDVVLFDREHLRVVIDCVMVLSKFSEAIRSIVQSFHIVCSSILHLICIVFDGVLEALHLSIDEASVRVDYRVRRIKLNSLVEIMNGILKPIKNNDDQTRALIILTVQCYDGSRRDYASILHFSYLNLPLR